MLEEKLNNLYHDSLEEKIQLKYKSVVDEISVKKILGLERYVHDLFDQIDFSIVSPYYPERAYWRNLSSEINPYLNELEKKAKAKLRQPFEDLKKITIGELIYFDDIEKHKVFCEKAKYFVEDLSYAMEIAAVKAYQVWEAEYNTPFIGNFARKKLRKKFGNEDLPEFNYVKKLIQKKRDETLRILNQYASHNITRSDEEEIYMRYNEQMGSISRQRTFLSEDYYFGNSSPRTGRDCYEELNRMTKWNRFKSEIKYSFKGFGCHGLFGTISGCIGAAFNYIFK